VVPTPYVVAEEAWEVGALEVSVGWTWSPFAHLVSDPTAAVPSIFGVVVVADGISLDLANDSQVPLGVRAVVVVEPSKDTEVLAILLELELSVTTNLSPFAIAISVVCKVPAFVIFP
jgi:hypothetical protein